VSADLKPLDPVLVPAAVDVCPDEFIIDPYQVERRLASINTHKACGPDDIPNWVWRDFSRWLAEPVCAIYNRSIQQGIVPCAWKCANVVPVPKVNPPTSIENDLRPISLTPTISKIIESFVGNWILDEIGDKLDKYQFGAIRGRSTTHELVDILQHWHQALNDNESIRVVFIDYAKAFDHVDHNIVINKLHKLGVSKILIRWVCSFLEHRMQRVKLSDTFSDWLCLKGSMPQGSWLGPLTFLILINDLTAPCMIHKFVDDTTLSEKIKTSKSSLMNHHLAEVLKWSTDSLMNINWKKTKEMIVGHLLPETVPELSVNNNAIQRVDVFKLLGVFIDVSLKWDSHVNAICSKAASRLYFLKLLKRSALSYPDLLHFYVAFIRPILEYACPVWHNSLTVEQSHRIETIQKRVLFIIYGNNIIYSDMCTKLQLSSLSDRRELLCKKILKSILSTDICLYCHNLEILTSYVN